MCNPLLNSRVLGAYLALKTRYLQEAAVTQCLQEFQGPGIPADFVTRSAVFPALDMKSLQGRLKAETGTRGQPLAGKARANENEAAPPTVCPYATPP